MSSRTLFYIIVISQLLSACVAIPEHHTVAGKYHESDSINTDCFGKNNILSSTNESTDQNDELNSQGFVLLNWNSHKGNSKTWQEDFEWLSSDSDLLVLQEGYLTEYLREQLNKKHYHWDIARAFAYNDIYAGVMTASFVKPDFLCSFRVVEPLSGIPKTVLITRYTLSDSDENLLVANVHMVNFSHSISSYRVQLQQTLHIVTQHRGPLIIAGDFNTWSEKRMKVLQNAMQELGATAVAFERDNRVSFMGLKVDHVFYRNLIPLNALTEKVTTSDHNPMLVTFKLAEDEK